ELLTPDSSIQKKYDVVFCGRLAKNKGVEDLLAAMVTIHPSPQLLLIGDGPLRRKLEARNSKLETHVVFTGWLPSPEDVYRAMQSANIFVMCSKSEGGPRVVLEAMALGLPVIATNVGIVPDIIRDGENGLITSGTPQDLAEKIQKLLSDDALRARLGLCARDVLQVFERRKLIREYAEFLQSFRV
ncbi:glycosyltransferase family 4 protein, partial [Candidatus Peregrinibacteria bacterium]|nr:glycosyltransferase family 4 protein [Candidatus Peregrinibacteria bacterium]